MAHPQPSGHGCWPHTCCWAEPALLEVLGPITHSLILPAYTGPVSRPEPPRAAPLFFPPSPCSSFCRPPSCQSDTRPEAASRPMDALFTALPLLMSTPAQRGQSLLLAREKAQTGREGCLFRLLSLRDPRACFSLSGREGLPGCLQPVFIDVDRRQVSRGQIQLIIYRHGSRLLLGPKHKSDRSET